MKENNYASLFLSSRGVETFDPKFICETLKTRLAYEFSDRRACPVPLLEAQLPTPRLEEAAPIVGCAHAGIRTPQAPSTHKSGPHSLDTRTSTHTHTAWDSDGVCWCGDVCYASAVRCSPDALGYQPLSLRARACEWRGKSFSWGY